MVHSITILNSQGHLSNFLHSKLNDKNYPVKLENNLDKCDSSIVIYMPTSSTKDDFALHITKHLKRDQVLLRIITSYNTSHEQALLYDNMQAKLVDLHLPFVVGSSTINYDVPLVSMLRSALLTGRIEVTDSRKWIALLWNKDLLRAIKAIINATNRLPKYSSYHLRSFSCTIAKLANNIASRTNCIIDWECKDEDPALLDQAWNNDKFSKDFRFLFTGNFTSMFDDLYSNVLNVLTPEEQIFVLSNPLPVHSVYCAPLQLNRLADVLLISHLYNEQLLIRSWIRTNSMHAARAIVIDYNSFDQTRTIFNEEAPDGWVMVQSKNKDFGFEEADLEVFEYAKKHRKEWVICLNTTEFLLHPCLRHTLNDKKEIMIRYRSHTLIGPNDKPWYDGVPIAQQRWTYNWFSSWDYSRYMYRDDDIVFTTGRHFIIPNDKVNSKKQTYLKDYRTMYTRDNAVEVPMELCDDEGILCKAAATPYPQNMPRKAQIQSRMIQKDIQRGWTHHLFAGLEQLKQWHENVFTFGPSYDLSETKVWQSLYKHKV